MKFDESTKQKLNEAIANDSWLYMEEETTVPFGWELPIFYLDYCAVYQLGAPTGVLSFTLPKAESIHEVNAFVEDFDGFLRNKIDTAQMLVYLSRTSTGHNSHGDDIILLQTEGCTGLTVYEDDTKLKKELRKGDIVYLPARYRFELQPLTPSCTVAFTLEKKND